MKNIVSTNKAPAAIGPYSQAVIANGVIYVSGQLPVNPETGKIESTDIKGQAKQLLMNVRSVLEEGGYEITDVVKATCFISNMSDFAGFNEVYGEFFQENPPARSCVAVRELPKAALCEVEVIASK
jgi:2-iminobutanoate/2-iminopropanoate deaminase